MTNARNRTMVNVRNYLCRFNQILDTMADKMLTAKMTNSITINFIECMIPHHQAAIYMCQNLLQYTNYKPLIEIAQNIIIMQSRGIEQMKDIARTTSGYFNTQRDLKYYTEKYLAITNEMICKMRNSPKTASINLNFVNEMIPHHEGAIAMCENLLQYHIDPRLICVAESIIKEQSDGVRKLKQVQKSLCK